MNFRLIDYLPILLMFVVAAGFAITFIVLSQLVGQRKRTRTKLMPYECGKDPVGSARERFSVKFYLIAMIFILFDIEVIFLVPWALVAAIWHAKFDLFRDAAVHRAAGCGFDLRNQKGRVRLEHERSPRGRSRSALAGRIGSASPEETGSVAQILWDSKT